MMLEHTDRNRSLGRSPARRAASVLGALALVVGFGGMLAATGCDGGSNSSGCRFDSWQGECTLSSVRTVKVVERFPQTFVVVEALYEPKLQGNVFPPPPFRKQIMAPAEFEHELTSHLQQYPTVHCVVQEPVGDPCAPTMAAAVPEFVPPQQHVAAVAEGCAKIEKSGGSNLPTTPVPLPGPFEFDQGSASENAQILSIVDDAVSAIKKDPRIQCVAIKGMSAPGEPFTLANDRSQLIRRLLEARGIDHTKVTVFEGTAPTYTASPDDQPVLSEHRRVHLSVVVYDNNAASQ
jgi:hypothetical protein